MLQKEFPEEIYLCGDFNIDLLKDENNESVNNFVDMLQLTLLQPKLLLPTRISTTLV